MALVGNTLKVDRSIYEILQILSFSLLDKTPINKILTNTDYNIDNELSYKQLKSTGNKCPVMKFSNKVKPIK